MYKDRHRHYFEKGAFLRKTGAVTKYTLLWVKSYSLLFFRSLQRRKTAKTAPKDNSYKEVRAMPRMSNKKRLEMSYYINPQKRIEHNKLCRACVYDCKQSFRALVISCTKYKSKRSD